MNAEKLAAARLYFILARQAPTAIIFRRGKSNQVQLIKWNLEDDTFEAGQWLRGRIYERRSDLSPDGSLLVYFAYKPTAKNWQQSSWTAISRPPYLKALSFWYKGDCWAGGGLFESNTKLLLNNGGTAHVLAEQAAAPPLEVGFLPVKRGEDDPIELARLQRDGWSLAQELDFTLLARPEYPLEDILTPAGRELHAIWNREFKQWFKTGFITNRPCILNKALGQLILSAEISLSGFKRRWKFSLAGPELTGPPDLSEVSWADWDAARQRLVFARHGSLFAWTLSGQTERHLAGFSHHQFEAREAPEWAGRW